MKPAGTLGLSPAASSRIGVHHGLGERLSASVLRLEGRKRREHPAELAGVLVPGKGVEEVPRRMASGLAVAGLEIDAMDRCRIDMLCHLGGSFRQKFIGVAAAAGRINSVTSSRTEAIGREVVGPSLNPAFPWKGDGQLQ